MDPIPIGSKIKYHRRNWIVGAVGLTGGERYYWLHRKNEVAMVPYFVLEHLDFGEPQVPPQSEVSALE